ncbi:phage holin family protein [Niabella sp. CJ426]|uniref:phage holin family protein n=1 Tax=Niabella sp. CJ426 TaxID=3393740 RepID=UPI003CFE991A
MSSFIQYSPDARLLTWLLIVFILDFIFGLLKASFNGIPRTSRGLRKSVIKLLQYGGCIIVSTVILNILYGSGENFGQQFAWIFGDMMLYFMIYIEVVSVMENMEAMAPASFFVRLFVRPVRRIITFRLKNLFQENTGTRVTHPPEKDIFKTPPEK